MSEEGSVCIICKVSHSYILQKGDQPISSTAESAGLWAEAT